MSLLLRYRYAVYAVAIFSFIFFFRVPPLPRDGAPTSATASASASVSSAAPVAHHLSSSLDATATGSTVLRRRRRRKRQRVDDGDAAQMPVDAPPSQRAWRDDVSSLEDEGRAFPDGVSVAASAPAVRGGASAGAAEGAHGVDSDAAAVRDALAVLARALADVPTVASDGAFSDSRADAALTRFAAAQAAMLSGEPGAPPPRFVAWRVTDKTSGMGLGNRLLGIVSAMGLAFATGRVFVVVDDPIFFASLEAVSPAEGGIDVSVDSARSAAARAGVNFDDTLHLAWGLGMDEKCACADFLTGTLASTVTLSMETTQYLAPCFTHNAGLRSHFVEAFGETTAIFRPLMLRFFRLRSALRDELSAFGLLLHPPRSPGAPRRHVVGLQIRTGHLIRPRSEEAVFYRCGEQLGELARLGRGAVTRASLDADTGGGGGGGGGAAVAALAKIEAALFHAGGAWAGGDQDVDVVFFVATDSEAVRERARAALGAHRVITYTPPTGSESGAAAVIDTWALSLCDDVILTYPKSTFGFVGALLSATGLPPHVVMSGSKTSGECVRLTSTEPVCEEGSHRQALFARNCLTPSPPPHTHLHTYTPRNYKQFTAGSCAGSRAATIVTGKRAICSIRKMRTFASCSPQTGRQTRGARTDAPPVTQQTGSCTFKALSTTRRSMNSATRRAFGGTLTQQCRGLNSCRGFRGRTKNSFRGRGCRRGSNSGARVSVQARRRGGRRLAALLLVLVALCRKSRGLSGHARRPAGLLPVDSSVVLS